MTWLTEHYDNRRNLVAGRKANTPVAVLEKQVTATAPPRDFAGALRGKDSAAIIAEVKYRSPSQGVLRDGDDVEVVAHSYAAAGASALSVLIDEQHFDGALTHLTRARQAVDLPALAKGFLVDPYEVLEARAAGADAVLLIATCLEANVLAEMHSLATELGMAALVEVHDQADLEKLVDVPVGLVGVNHRNLATLEMDMTMTATLGPLLPPAAVKVAESGLSCKEDIDSMRALGYDAVLMGTRFMGTPNPGEALKELLAGKATS